MPAPRRPPARPPLRGEIGQSFRQRRQKLRKTPKFPTSMTETSPVAQGGHSSHHRLATNNRKADEFHARCFRLPLRCTSKLQNPIEIIPVFLCYLMANCVNFFQRRHLIPILHTPNSSLLSMKSAGVMTTGHSYPALEIAEIVLGKAMGFAICLQFSVRRTSIA